MISNLFIPSLFVNNRLCFIVMTCCRNSLRLCLSTTVMRTLCSLYTVFCTISFINHKTTKTISAYENNVILFVNASKREHKIKKKDPSGFLRKGLGANYEKDVCLFGWLIVNLLLHGHIPYIRILYG